MSDKTTFGQSPEQLQQILKAIGLEESDRAEPGDLTAPTQTTEGRFAEKTETCIGPYKLLRVLGEGGMGIVYLAEQSGAIRRKVALKVIKPGMDSKRVVARFETERQALALLDHPGIAQVYDAGTGPNGRPYFVMEYVKGQAITEYCDRRRFNLVERLRLFKQVCQAVHHAHQKGIIHRDLKPSNILVSTEGDQAMPKIIDFGVAKAVSQPLTEQTLYTVECQMLGTPEYMSPEQIEMMNEDIDTRSDIYSLGVLLYVLLAGILPYGSEELRESGIEHLRQTIRDSDPKTPSTRLAKLGDEGKAIAEQRRTQIHTLAKHLQRELEWIPLKAMQKDRAERYRSATELADDIENYLKGEPLIAGPPSAIYRLKKSVQQHKALASGIAAVLLVSVIGTVVSVHFALGQANALAQKKAMVGFLNRDILDELGHESFKPASIRKVFDKASVKLEDVFEDYPLLEADVRFRFGKIYGWQLGEPNAALTHLERAIELGQRESQGNAFHTKNYLALAYMKAGKYQEAEAEFSHMVNSIEQTQEQQGKQRRGDFYWAIKSHLGATWRLMGRYDEAEPYIRAAPLHPWWDDGHWREFLYEGRIAALLRDQGRYEEAGQLYEELLRNRHRSEDKEDSEIMKELGVLYALQGKLDQAASMLTGALAGAQKEFGAEHWTTMDIKIALAILRTKQGDDEKAESLFDEALANMKARLDDYHPELLAAKSHLGVLYREQKRFEEAETLLSDTLQRQSEKLGADHPAALQTKHELAVLHLAQSQYEKAEPLLQAAFQGRETKLGPEHPHTVETLNHLAKLYEAMGKPDEAKTWRAKLAE